MYQGYKGQNKGQGHRAKEKALKTQGFQGLKLVREAGLEPARPEWTLEPESSESANSTTRASLECLIIIAPRVPLVKHIFSVFDIFFAVQKQGSEGAGNCRIASIFAQCKVVGADIKSDPRRHFSGRRGLLNLLPWGSTLRPHRRGR